MTRSCKYCAHTCCSNLDIFYFFHHLQPDGSNSASVVRPAMQQVRSAQPYSNSTNRPSEEDERVKENNDVKVSV